MDMKKFNKGNYSHMIDHYNRYDGNSYVKYGNREIQKDLSYLNYNLAGNHSSKEIKQKLKDRIAEIDTDYVNAGGQVLKRKDRVIMVGCVIDCPEELMGTESADIFFQLAYEWLCEQFGKDNIIDCVVHKDEVHSYVDSTTGEWTQSRWHMHAAIVPAVKDEKVGAYKVLAKNFTNRTNLSVYHRELDKYIYSRIGVHTLTGNPENKITGRKTEELKELSARAAFDKQRELERNFEEAQSLFEEKLLTESKKLEVIQERQETELMLQSLFDKQNELENEILKTETLVSEHKERQDAIKSEISIAENHLKEIKGEILNAEQIKSLDSNVKVRGIINKREVTEMSYKDYLDIKSTAEIVPRLQQEILEKNEEIEKTKDLFLKYYDGYHKEKNINMQLKETNNTLMVFYKAYRYLCQILEQNPKLSKLSENINQKFGIVLKQKHDTERQEQNRNR